MKTGNDTIELLEKVVKMLEENEKEIILLKELASKIASFNERSEIEL